MYKNKHISILLIIAFLGISHRICASQETDNVDAKIKLFGQYPETLLRQKLNSGVVSDKIAAGYLMGKLLYKAKKYEEAYLSFREVLEKYPKLLSRDLTYRLRLNCGFSLKATEQYELSLFYLKSADTLLDKEKKDELALLDKVFGTIFFELGQYDSASIYLQKAEVLYIETKNEKPLSGIYNKLGTIASSYNSPRTAISCYEKSRLVAKKYDLKIELSEAMINLGIEYKEIQELDKSALVLREALNLANSIHYKEGEIHAMISIAELFAWKKDYLKALEFLQKSDSISSGIDDPKIKIALLSDIGTVYKLMKQFDKALTFFIQIEHLEQGNGMNTANTEFVIGEIYKLQNDLGMAQEYLERSRKKFLAAHNLQGRYRADFQIAEIQIRQNHPNEAKQTLLKLLEEIKGEKLEIYNETESGIYLRLSEVYTAQNDAAKALAYYKEYEKLNAKKQEKAYNFDLARIENDSKLFKLDARIKILDAQNSAKALEIVYQQRKSWTFISIAFIFIGLSVFLFKLYSDKNKLYSELVKRNLELAKHQPFQEEKATINKITEEELAKSKEIVNQLIALFENQQVYLKQDISLILVSEMLKTNRTYLSKAIRDVLNTNFNLLINKYRIEKARVLLTDPAQKLSIEGIAYNVGFSSKSTFNVAFKNLTGLTPSNLRDEVLKKKASLPPSD
jgi:AraC-like DNA-binding protein